MIPVNGITEDNQNYIGLVNPQDSSIWNVKEKQFVSALHDREVTSNY